MTRLAERAKNQQKHPKDQKVTEPEQQPKPLSPVEQKVQEARAERAPEPDADEETLAGKPDWHEDTRPKRNRPSSETATGTFCSSSEDS